eukprot:m.161737 g.161737  ORF g.161737 m.161737 type:complete len:399 (+) comp12110_c0_seq1:74-1270(+)
MSTLLDSLNDNIVIVPEQSDSLSHTWGVVQSRPTEAITADQPALHIPPTEPLHVRSQVARMMRLVSMLTVAASVCTAAPLAPTIPELAQQVPELSTLVEALTAAKLINTLSSRGPFTVFAPTNEAFAALPPGTLDFLLMEENRELLVQVLTYHVIGGASVFSAEIQNNEMITTLEGSNITAHVFKRTIAPGIYDKRIQIEDLAGNGKYADVVKANNVASNGVVHIIDRVLLPGPIQPNPPKPTPNPGLKNIGGLVASIPELSTLFSAVEAAGLVYTLESGGPFTLFAPTDEAFSNLPTGVLQKLLQPESKDLLVKVLTFHLVSGAVQSGSVHNDQVIKTVEGKSLLAKVTAYPLKHIFLQDHIGERHLAEVIKPDVEATNGVVHVIDKVLLPPLLELE